MTVLVHFSGPSYGKTAVLEPGAAPVDVGRDPQAGIYLPDQDRLISRRHVSIEWDEGGVKVNVLSRVNGVTTPRGDFGAGESVVLAPGETAQIGRFTFVAERVAPGTQVPLATIEADGPTSVSDDPFFLPTQQGVPSEMNPPAALAVAPAPARAKPAPAAGGFSSGSTQPGTTVPEPAAPADNADPWAAFAKEWVPEGAARKPAEFPTPPSLNRALDDAFSSSTAWRVEDMPPVDPLASASFESEKVLGAAFSVPAASEAPARTAPEDTQAALRALCRGLGVSGPPRLREDDWEQLGRTVRQVVQGLSDLIGARDELKKEMRAVDRTMLGAQENNPLKNGMPLDELLHWLLFMPQGAAGCLPVRRALDESIDELRAHERASLAAVRAVVEGALAEFEPGKLRTALLKGKRSIGVLDNARLWDLYTAHYQDKGEHLRDWVEQVFSRHFIPTYSREAERLRRESQARGPQAHVPRKP